MQYNVEDDYASDRTWPLAITSSTRWLGSFAIGRILSFGLYEAEITALHSAGVFCTWALLEN